MRVCVCVCGEGGGDGSGNVTRGGGAVWEGLE